MKPIVTWIDTFAIMEEQDNTWPSSGETVFNCSREAVFRNQDTVYLESFFYDKPDSSQNYEYEFNCASGKYHKFLLDKNGKGTPLGDFTEGHQANLRVVGDSLLYDMAIVYLDFYPVRQDVPSLIRYIQYGHEVNADSLQQVLIDLPRPLEHTGGPFFFVTWHTWVYLASDRAANELPIFKESQRL